MKMILLMACYIVWQFIVFVPTVTAQYTQYVFDPTPNTGSFNVVAGDANGDFEFGLSGWSNQNPDRGQFILSSENFFGNGSFSVKTDTLTDGVGAGYALVTSQALTPNTDYVISAYFNAQGLAQGNLRVQLLDIPGADIRSPIAFDDWHFLYRTFNSGPNSSAVLRVIRDQEQSTSDNGFVDKIGVTKLSDFVPPSSCTKLKACSVNDFSGEQGQNGWFYGFYDGPFLPSDFDLMKIFDDNGWWVDNIPGGELFWTFNGANHCHPNGQITSGGRTPEEHWVVRRYVFDTSGPFHVIARFVDANTNGGNGIVARVYDADQQVVESVVQNGTFATQFEVFATPGHSIDFVVDPRASDDRSDGTDIDLFILNREQNPKTTTSFTSSKNSQAVKVFGNLADQINATNLSPPTTGFADSNRHQDLHVQSNFTCESTAGALQSVAGDLSDSQLCELIPPDGTISDLTNNEETNPNSILIFKEGSRIRLSSPLAADWRVGVDGTEFTYSGNDLPIGGEIETGRFVTSHLLHFDTENGVSSNKSGSATFDSEILGVILETDNLNASDSELGVGGVIYPTAPGRGWEIAGMNPGFGSIRVSADGMSIEIAGLVDELLDQMRIITAASPEDFLDQPYVSADEFIDGADEVTFDNCSSAWYRFTFELPDNFTMLIFLASPTLMMLQSPGSMAIEFPLK